jgi:transposase InsO family protein
MSQVYHSNAKTNQHSRERIHYSSLSNIELSAIHGVSVKTISKWKNREHTSDKSSRPHTIHYKLTALEKEIISVVRKLTWMPLDDLVDTVASSIPAANRSNVYRTLMANHINTVPQEKKAKAKIFKEYEPGYLHIDVTYLPKIEGKKHYLFVAIDRATRLIYYKIYERKTAQNASDFLEECKAWFPFYLTHILTDNGLEFTDKYARGNTKASGNHLFDQACTEDNIEHRLTAPFTPQTNGMVERANGTIKQGTIKAQEYGDLKALEKDLNQFLLYYNFNRRHGSLRKELKVRTPFEALQSWFQTKPEIFKISPDAFRAYAFNEVEQRGET